MRRAPVLLLLAALLGGLGASTVHRAAHAVEWAETQRTHAKDHHENGTDRVSVPCAGGDLHALDCAICSGMSGVALAEVLRVGDLPDAEQQVEATEAWAVVRRAATPARGPPAVA